MNENTLLNELLRFSRSIQNTLYTPKNRARRGWKKGISAEDYLPALGSLTKKGKSQ
jgi:hypothetical protein